MSYLTGGFKIVRWAAAARFVACACVLALVGSGCTPTPPPQPTPTPSATPTETAQEREERLAYEAAEKSYREFRAEYRRALNAGGATGPTPLMKQTAGGAYLAESVEVLKAYKGLNRHSTGQATIAYVRRQGYSPTSLLLQTCEDGLAVKTFDASGKVVGRGEVRTSEIQAEMSDGKWKMWSGTGRKVTSCE